MKYIVIKTEEVRHVDVTSSFRIPYKRTYPVTIKCLTTGDIYRRKFDIDPCIYINDIIEISWWDRFINWTKVVRVISSDHKTNE